MRDDGSTTIGLSSAPRADHPAVGRDAPTRRTLSLSTAALLAAAVALCGAPPAAAAELGLEVETVSGYLFRGMLLNPEACLQPATTLTLGDLSFEGWASINLTDEQGDAGGLGEVDLSLAYSDELAGVDVVVGLTHYRVATPEAGHTTELLGDLVVPWAAVELRVLLAWDVDAARGLYVRAALGRAVDLAKGVSVDLQAGTGWADANMSEYTFGVARSGFAEASASATLELETRGLTLWTRIEASWLWRRDLRLGAADFYGDASPAVIAVGFSTSFPRADG